MATQQQVDHLRELSRQIDALHAGGQMAESADLLAKALLEAKEIDPAYALFFQGEQAGYLEEDLPKQESLFREAISLRPQDYHLQRNLGVTLSKQDNEDEAIACFDKAIELNPKDHQSWRQKGVSLSNLGKESEAIACYDKALELNPKYHITLRDKGVSLTNLGKHKIALDVTERALALNAEDVNAQVNKAWIMHRLGNKAEALALIEKVTKANPQHEYARRIHRYLKVLHGATPAVLPVSTPAPKPAAKPAPKPAVALLEGPQNQQMDDLKAVVERVRGKFEPFVEDILQKMEKSTAHINDFLWPKSRLREDVALFCLLRKWNSYTPCIPREDDERSIGGGYYFLVNGVGTVVDPGYNFLENFHRIGGRITDIDNIVITHAHNDHTADLESILSLVYRFNSDENKDAREKAGAQPKRIRLFLNAGCQMKFSGLIDLRGAEYLEDVQTLMPGYCYDMGEGLSLRALRAYHDEVVARKYAVGLDFTLVNKEAETTRVVITADTGLFPQTKDRKADVHGKQIWEDYHLQPGATHLLVPHLGSVKKEEFTASFNTNPQEVFYANHLGLMGTVQVIAALKPELAVVSEFGEELKDIQPKLMEMIAECVHSFQPVAEERTVVLPGDLTFLYELRKRSVYCVACEDWVLPSAELVAEPWSDKKNQELFYYYSKAKLGMTKLSAVAERFQKKLSDQSLSCLHEPKKPG